MSGYERFLGAREEAALPYFGGPYVEAPDRRLRITEPVRAGFWRFAVSGRHARPVEPAEPPALDHLPPVRGHLAAGYVFAHRAEALALDPGYEPPRFAAVTARRWPSGELLPGSLDFEGEAEELARRAYEEGGDIGGVKGVPASLRAAFGYALLHRLARERGVAVAPAEVRGRLAGLAGGADPAATLAWLAAERVRRTESARAAARTRAGGGAGTRGGAPDQNAAGQSAAGQDVPAQDIPGRIPPGQDAAGRGRRRGGRPGGGDPLDRAARALRSAGATVLDLRRQGADLVEVRYRFAGERFVSVADAATLQVVDAGICLSGGDRMVTLESLPSVIREAMDGDELVITRWA